MVFRFDDVVVDCRALEVHRADRSVPLGPLAFDFLRYLIEARDRVVLRDELLDQLWGDVCVGEAVLTRCASVVRRALGDSATSPRYLRTVYGRGYRFIGRIRVESEATAPRLAAPFC